MNAAARPAQFAGGQVQKLGGFGRQGALRVDGLALQCLVGAALAAEGALTRGDYAGADAGAAFARRRVDQFMRGQRAHFHVKVNAVQQRAAEPALVARHLLGRAAAGAQA